MKRLLIGLLALFAVSAAVAGTVEGPLGVQTFVRGGFNDWGLANLMTYDDGSQAYTATISLAVGDYEFKIASEDWSTVDLGNIDGVGQFSPPATVNAGRTAFGDFMLSILVAGDYDFILDVSSLLPGRGDPSNGPFPLTVRQSVVPVPAAGLLMLSALGGLGFLRRRR